MSVCFPRRSSLTVLAVITLLAACFETRSAPTGLENVAPFGKFDPRLLLLDPGAPGLIVICSAGGPASFTVTASPARGTLAGGGSFSVETDKCVTAWTAIPGDLTTVTIVVRQTSGDFDYIEATAVPEVGLPRMTVDQTNQRVRWDTNAEHGGSATFFQHEPTPPPPPPPESKKLVVCKDGPAGLTWTFTVSSDAPSGDVFPNGQEFTLQAGECKDAWEQDGPPVDPFVTVTEVGDAPLDSIRKELQDSAAVVLTGTRAVTSRVGFAHGGVVSFFNASPPPPPPVGGQGCTPGYWKQKQHFGNWTAPYVPTGPGATDFDAAFGVDAFTPNITLLEALGLNGGGLNALARHAAAALLNAASDPVNYDLSVAQVVALVQGAIASGDYEATKNKLASFNEQSCPLVRAEQ
jgi:hypothetical protein